MLPRSLLVKYEKSGDKDYLDTALRLIQRWLSRYTKGAPDSRYVWYDHGTAMRLMTLLMAFGDASEAKLDAATERQLAHAIYRHAELLSSDWFYVLNQPMRWHNHAMFQDKALLVAAAALPMPQSRDWIALATKRIRKQFDHLVTNGGVSVENSYGYHWTEARLCSTTTLLVRKLHLKGVDSWLQRMQLTCAAMDEFTDKVIYPDGRAPSYGDSHPQLNKNAAPDYMPSKSPSRYHKLWAQAGYFVARGAKDVPWQLTFLAPSLSITHKHEDNLELIYWADGVSWIVDPGFYTHEYTKPISAFSRKQGAHNFLRVVGRDYTLEPGHAMLHSVPIRDGFEVWGVSTSVSGVIGQRRIRGGLFGNRLQIHDRVTGLDEAVSSTDMTLQFGDGVSASIRGGAVSLRYPGVSSEVVLHSKAFAQHCDVLHADTKHPKDGPGWVYPAFAVAKPADALVCHGLPSQVDWSIQLKQVPGDGINPTPGVKGY